MGRQQGDDVRYTIGQLVRRTGLTVKAIRFYADRGIVPPTGRSAAGHRRYSAEAEARLELVQTLRSLGFGLRTVRTVLNEETPSAEAAATQAAALADQIETLRRPARGAATSPALGLAGAGRDVAGQRLPDCPAPDVRPLRRSAVAARCRGSGP
ncbi:MerR family transcriptional regulator [Kibdelosporangium persicum]|uniref:MerR family transcriptional regulator n=1 Tax=Kibdelosporangium persicum TaxID=2698649 RepID=UPI0015640DE6|nr:MerR family transcriptional regulator [Kibdelosporangium persicum]